MKRKIIWYILLILAVTLLQYKLAPSIRIAHVAPNLCLAFTVAVGVVFGQVEGAVIGLISGMMIDSQSVLPFGVYALLGFFTGFLAGIVSKSEIKYMIAISAAAAAVLTFLYELILFTISSVSNSINWLSGMGYVLDNYWNAISSVIFIAMLYNAAFCCLFYLLLGYVVKKRRKSDVVNTYSDK